ncbi:MAG: hypothetical protein H6861_01810 [Rhodospirillales bacterium]|nr:hypothetical protein [Rhodospirillales bacterium]
MYATGGSFALVGSEKAYQWAFDDDEDTWMGNTGRWFGQKALYTADTVRDWTVGFAKDVPYLGATLNAVPIEEANEYFFRANAPEKKESSSPEDKREETRQRPAGMDLRTYITTVLDPDIQQRTLAVAQAKARMNAAQQKYDLLDGIADQNESKKGERDTAKTALETAKKTFETLSSTLLAKQYDRDELVIALYLDTTTLTDPTEKLKLEGVLWDIRKYGLDSGNKIKDFDLLNDALFAEAQVLAQKEEKHSKKDIAAAVKKVFGTESVTTEKDAKASEKEDPQPYSQGGSSASKGRSASQLFEDAIGWSTEWTGADPKSGWMKSAFNWLGDWGQIGKGFWNDLSSPWKAGLIGLLGAFTIGPWLKNQLGAVGNFPLVGLLIGAVVFALTGKAAHAFMTDDAGVTQGKAKHSTKASAAKQGHDGSVEYAADKVKIKELEDKVKALQAQRQSGEDESGDEDSGSGSGDGDQRGGQRRDNQQPGMAPPPPDPGVLPPEYQIDENGDELRLSDADADLESTLLPVAAQVCEGPNGNGWAPNNVRDLLRCGDIVVSPHMAARAQATALKAVHVPDGLVEEEEFVLDTMGHNIDSVPQYAVAMKLPTMAANMDFDHDRPHYDA